MTTEIELLPLPEGYDKYSPPRLYDGQMFHEGQMRAYARANSARAIAPLRAEIEALRETLATLKVENEKLREVLKDTDNEQAQPVYRCHIDLEEGMEPDDCVLDSGRRDDCFYARLHGDRAREYCGEWKPIQITKHPPHQRRS